ncbi:Transcriptional regulator, AcrR family [hydrothermal vent metagenome]|uniref:Transcriptional regulator, AcrR family n=1 Tax=hydrothermal vent metagenome TaxID=652676 RepID=A0A3B0XC94_9ZZZZ
MIDAPHEKQAQLPAMSRKQRELYEREQLILDTAQQILQQAGLQSLTMERVAAQIEYSKGTVYNHFSSKEEIVNAISCRCVSNLIEMFNRAKNHSGNHRERIAGISIAHSLYAQLHPAEIQNMQIIKSSAVREKISREKQIELLALEQQIIGIAQEIILDAIHDGDIPQGQPHVPDSILLGLWSMGYGSNLLHLTGIPFDQLGMHQPLEMMWINSHKLLDSYQWQPLSSEFDIYKLREKLQKELFPGEMQLLKNTVNTPAE